jgi:hypothetical protein
MFAIGPSSVERLGPNMHDPMEGLTSTGLIRTGVDRAHIPDLYNALLDTVVQRVRAEGSDISVYVYGSVATGQAQPPTSDVDVLTIDLPSTAAGAIGAALSAQFADVCRGVEVAAGTAADIDGDGDEAYGRRVFLHHYCVHLSGPDRDRARTGFPGDVRAARGFNGDIAHHAQQWRDSVGSTEDEVLLGRRIARKTLLAVAGLVSVHDSIWTTDRQHAAFRWCQVEPDLAEDLTRLLEWATDQGTPGPGAISRILDTAVSPITTQFADRIGLWTNSPQ